MDLGETALAVFGMHALLEGEPYPLMGKGKLKEILDYPDKIAKAAKVLAEDEVETPEYEQPKSYRQLLDRLSAPLQPGEVQHLVSRFHATSSDISGPFSVKAQEAWEYLRSIFPTAEYQTFSGPEQIVPDDAEVWQFFSVLWVLQDPLIAFPLMALGALLDHQVEALRQVYPSLTQDMETAIYSVMAENRAKNSKFHFPAPAEDGIATFLNREQEVSKSDTSQDKPEPVSPAQSAPLTSTASAKDATNLLTKTQASLNH